MPDLAQAVSGVVRELLQSRPAPRCASVFLYQREVTQLTPCCGSSRIPGQTLASTLLRFLRQVKLKFLAQFGFLVSPSCQPAQFAKEGVHRAS
jgi:hypothetical protein